MGVETLLIIAAASSAVGGALSAFSSIQQGRQANAMAKYNANVSNENAKATQFQSDIELQNVRSKYRRLRGTQDATAAASGIAGGSFTDILTDTKMQEDLDTMGLLYKTKTTAQGYNNQATLSLAAGRNAQSQGMLNAAGTIIGTAGKTAGIMSNYPTLSDG